MAENKLLIVGGGIAGITFAWQAQRRGLDVTLIDRPVKDSPSRVAAGILNPLSVSRKKAIWNAAEFSKAAWSHYQSLQADFVHEEPMHIPLTSQKDANDWWSGNAAECGHIAEVKEGAYGWVKINNSGWIDTEAYLAHTPPGVKTEELDLNDISQLQLRAKEFDWVLVATGSQVFPELMKAYRPDIFRPVLGDVLMVEAEAYDRFVHLEGMFMIPRGEGRFVMGSTYINRFKSIDPDPERARQLMDKAERQGVRIRKLLSHRCAVRPAVFDRKPLVGPFEGYKKLVAFTGMGSRGILHAPLLANQVLDHCLDGTKIWEEVNIKRALPR